MILWLHERGYNYFQIPLLTYPEISDLVEASNRKIKKENKDAKKASRKRK